MHAFARAGLSNAWQWLPCPSQIGVLCCANAQTLTPKTVCCQTTKLFNNNPESFTPYPGLIWGTSIIYHIYIYDPTLLCNSSVDSSGAVLLLLWQHRHGFEGLHSAQQTVRRETRIKTKHQGSTHAICNPVFEQE